MPGHTRCLYVIHSAIRITRSSSGELGCAQGANGRQPGHLPIRYRRGPWNRARRAAGCQWPPAHTDDAAPPRPGHWPTGRVLSSVPAGTRRSLCLSAGPCFKFVLRFRAGRRAGLRMASAALGPWWSSVPFDSGHGRASSAGPRLGRDSDGACGGATGTCTGRRRLRGPAPKGGASLGRGLLRPGQQPVPGWQAPWSIGADTTHRAAGSAGAAWPSNAPEPAGAPAGTSALWRRRRRRPRKKCERLPPSDGQVAPGCVFRARPFGPEPLSTGIWPFASAAASRRSH